MKKLLGLIFCLACSLSQATTLQITTTSCSGGEQGQAYAGCAITAAGGTPPYTFAVAPWNGKNWVQATLPEGMVINPVSGQISASLVGGTGHYVTELMVTDSLGATAYKPMAFSIGGNSAWMADIFPANSIFHHKVDAIDCPSCTVDTSPAAPLTCSYGVASNWVAGYSFAPGQLVTYGGKSYIAKYQISPSGAVPLGSSDWIPIAVWNAQTAYQKGTIIDSNTTINYMKAYYTANAYVASNQAPPASNSNWSYKGPSNSNCALTPVSQAFGNAYGGNIPFGIPTVSVPYTQPHAWVTANPLHYDISFTQAPIPSYAPIQYTAFSTSDRHVIVYQQAGPNNSPAASLYEMYQGVYQPGAGTWTNTSNVSWSNVATNNKIGGGVNASGMTMAGTLLYPEEVIGTGTPTAPNGAVKHVTRFVMLNSAPYFVWPATGISSPQKPSYSCSNSAGPIPVRSVIGQGNGQAAAPVNCTMSGVFGQIFRLKASAYATLPACFANSPEAKILATGFYQYGIIFGDSGFDGQVAGTPDTRWVDSDLRCLAQLNLQQFEPVNVSGLWMSNSSGQTSK